MHGRPHRQRPALPRLRHPRHRRRSANSRRSRTCWCTASCPTARRARRATRQSSRRCAACPSRCSEMLEQHSGGRASDGRHAHRASRRSARVLPEKDDHSVARRARHRRPADGLARLDAAVLVSLQPATASASTSRPTTTRSAATSCICCTARRRRASWVRAMHTSLNLYAEHEFNASTFTARVIAGTGSDMYSAITGAIGALRGPKHGGANEVRIRDRRSATTAPTKPKRTSAGASRRKEVDHRLRPPGLHDRRPAQQGDQGGRAQLSRGRGQHEDVRHRRAHRER